MLGLTITLLVEVVLVVLPALMLPTLLAGGSVILDISAARAAMVVIVNLVALFQSILTRSEVLRAGPRINLRTLATVAGATGLIATGDLVSLALSLILVTYGTRHAEMRADSQPDSRAFGLVSGVLLLFGVGLIFVSSGTIIIISRIDPAVTQAATSPGGIGIVIIVFVLASQLWPNTAIRRTGLTAANLGSSVKTNEFRAGEVFRVVGVVVTIGTLARLIPSGLHRVTLWLGLAVFLMSQLGSAADHDVSTKVRRMTTTLGGLALLGTGLAGLEGYSQTYVVVVVYGLLAGLLLAAPAVFWGASTGLAGNTAIRFLGLAIAGAPPFAGFWAIWQLLNSLAATGRVVALVATLVGWVAVLVTWIRDPARAPGDHEPRATPIIAVALLWVLGAALGMFAGWTLGMNDRVVAAPVVGFALVLAVEFLPVRVRALVAGLVVTGYAVLVTTVVSGLALIFCWIAAFATLWILVRIMGRPGAGRTSIAGITLGGLALCGMSAASEPITLAFLWMLVISGVALARGRERVHEQTGRHDPGAVPGSEPGRLFLPAALVLVVIGLVVALQGGIDGPDAGARFAPELYGADGYVRLPALSGGWPPGSTVPSEAAGVAARVVGVSVDSPGVWAQQLAPGGAGYSMLLMGLGFLCVLGAGFQRHGRNEHPGLAPLAAMFGITTVVIMFGAGGRYGEVLVWLSAAIALLTMMMAILQRRTDTLVIWAVIGQTAMSMFAISTATAAGIAGGVLSLVLAWLSAAMLLAADTALRRKGQLALIAGFWALLVIGVPPIAGFAGKWLMTVAALKFQIDAPTIVVGIAWIMLIVAAGRGFLLVLRSSSQPPGGAGSEPGTAITSWTLLAASGVILIGLGVVPQLVLRPLFLSVGTFFPGVVTEAGRVFSPPGYTWNRPVLAYSATALVAGALGLIAVLIGRRAGKYPRRPVVETATGKVAGQVAGETLAAVREKTRSAAQAGQAILGRSLTRASETIRHSPALTVIAMIVALATVALAAAVLS